MSAGLKPCAQCGVPCDDLFGIGDEHHCSHACHDKRLRVLSFDNMTEQERILFTWLARVASPPAYPVVALAVVA